MSKSKIIKDSIIEIENIKQEAKLLAKEEILNEVQYKIEQRTKELFENKLKSMEDDDYIDEEFTTDNININEEDCGCDDEEEPLEEKINKEKKDLKNKMKKNKLNLQEEDMSLYEYMDLADDDDDIDVEALHKSGEISDEAYNMWKQSYGETNNNNNMSNTEELDETWNENKLMEFLNELDSEDMDDMDSEDEDMDDMDSEDEDMNDMDSEDDDMEGEEFNFDDIEIEDDEDMDSEDDDMEDMDSEDDDMDDMDSEDEEDMNLDEFMDFNDEDMEAMDLEDDMDDMDLEDDDMEDFEEMDLEEALAYPNQIHKNVGGKSFPQRDGAPERRSNMNEDIKRLRKLVGDVVNENKTLKNKVKKTKALETLLEETKSKLYDTLVLAQKTVYANKVLFENTLTESEKAEVMKAFNKANTKAEIISLNESFNTKFTENKRSINSSISKIISTSKGILKEHTISDQNGTSRMKELMGYKLKK
jgi:hypothetical protein